MLEALWIVLLGMALIFTVLGILLGMMILLNKLIKPNKTDR
jgi:Na+-transporting methylmalonyl-CoA/oxaloacetate decarboxylase gamma subunit